MLLSNFRLPQFSPPTEESLNEENSDILTAVNTILSSFKRSQDRTREITKAYNKLESITRQLIEDCGADKEISSESERKKLSIDRTPLKRNSDGTAKLQIERSKIENHKNVTHGTDNRSENVMKIELTTSSPIVSSSRRQIPKKSLPGNESWREDSIKKVDSRTEAAGCSKLPKSDNLKTGNEENEATFSINIPDNFRQAAKIGLAKSSFNSERVKLSTGKTVKQTTLAFRPVPTEIDLTKLENSPAEEHDAASRSWANIFDVDYCYAKNRNNNFSDKKTAPKNPADRRVDHSEPSTCDFQKVAVSPLKKKDESTDSKKINDADSRSAKEDKNQSLRKLINVPDTNEINETAQSLFDDEEIDGNFQDSPDIMNTCVQSHSDIDNLNRKPGEIGAKNEIQRVDDSKSQSSQEHRAFESIDETFFAPAEILRTEIAKTREFPVAGPSKFAKPPDKPAPFNRKPVQVPAVDDAQALDNLALQDINWDADDSDDDWMPAKKPAMTFPDMSMKTFKKNLELADQQTGRTKAQRNKLPGWNCRDCEQYYANLNLPEEELQKRMNACSRHKAKFNPRYYTPKGFWNPEFTQDSDSSDYSDSERRRLLN